MKFFSIIVLLYSFVFSGTVKAESNKKMTKNINYISNRQPLASKPYIELPLGAIKPKGWLEEQLQRMATGMTGHLDELYVRRSVVREMAGWVVMAMAGNVAPYWLDGLLPLAYILEDAKLIEKTKPWIEWSLNNQAEDGYFGPIPFETEPENRGWHPKRSASGLVAQNGHAKGPATVLQCNS